MLKEFLINQLILVSGNKNLCSILLTLVSFLPTAKIRDYEPHLLLVRYYSAFINILRTSLNKKASAERGYLADKYIIPLINALFDKNYINFAQITLFALEEYFLSKRTEKDFEDVLAAFSEHAIKAGERFRDKYPLSLYQGKKESDKIRIGFVGHFVATSGYEVVMGLGPSFKDYCPKMYALRAFNVRGKETVKSVFEKNGIGLVLPEDSSNKPQVYDIFLLRKMMMETPVDVAIWPLPPFHMFFLFSFGVAKKQVWFSNYLRSNIKFAYLHGLLTPGGAGMLSKKNYNNREWDILPQIAYIEGLYNPIQADVIDKPIYLFTPARLEKLKQPLFMDCVAQILQRVPSAHFKWTGYNYDQEVVKFFDQRGLQGRHTYYPWLSQENLLREIRESNLILSSFPLSLGTVEYMAAHYRIPIISMYDEECNLYWRDIYWEALNGNQLLKNICLDERGNSKIIIAKTPEEYVETAIKVMGNEYLMREYTDIYYKSYDYAYHNNPNNIREMVKYFIQSLFSENTK